MKHKLLGLLPEITGGYSQSFRLSRSGEGSRIRISETLTGDGCGCGPGGYTLSTAALDCSPYLKDGGLWGPKSSVICQKSRNGVKARSNSFHHHRHRHHLYYHAQVLRAFYVPGVVQGTYAPHFVYPSPQVSTGVALLSPWKKKLLF